MRQILLNQPIWQLDTPNILAVVHGDQQPFSAVRSQSEHGGEIRRHEGGPGRAETVYHDAERPSQILLPVIPPRTR
jgi:hypothetical protein